MAIDFGFREDLVDACDGLRIGEGIQDSNEFDKLVYGLTRSKTAGRALYSPPLLFTGNGASVETRPLGNQLARTIAVAYPLAPAELSFKKPELTIVKSPSRMSLAERLDQNIQDAFEQGYMIYSIQNDHTPVSEERLRQAYEVVARGYAKLSDGQLSVDKVNEDLGRGDKIYQSNATTTFIVNKGDRTIATARLVAPGAVKGIDIVPSPIEALELFKPSSSDQEWSDVLGVDPVDVGELGRYSILDGVVDGHRGMVTALLFKATTDRAQLLGVKALIAVMPGYVRNRLEKSGIESEEIPGVGIDMANPLYQSLARDFPTYWNPPKSSRLPKLYYLYRN